MNQVFFMKSIYMHDFTNKHLNHRLLLYDTRCFNWRRKGEAKYIEGTLQLISQKQTDKVLDKNEKEKQTNDSIQNNKEN